MKNTEIINHHYGRDNLGRRILERIGKGDVTTADLAPFDELHLGGRKATEYLASAMDIADGQSILDIGCGLGGAARHVAETYDAQLSGVDVTDSYITAATLLSEKTGLGDKTDFRVADATALPFEDSNFDHAYTIHTAMNIADKQAMYHEAARVMKPGGVFAIYDVLADTHVADMAYPTPWASQSDESHLVTIEETQDMLTQSGFIILSIEDRNKFALQAFDILKGALSQDKHLVHKNLTLIFGPDYDVKITNIIANVENRRCGPWQILAKKE